MRFLIVKKTVLPLKTRILGDKTINIQLVNVVRPRSPDPVRPAWLFLNRMSHKSPPIHMKNAPLNMSVVSKLLVFK